MRNVKFQFKELFNSNPSNSEDRRAMMESFCSNIRTDLNSVIDEYLCVLFSKWLVTSLSNAFSNGFIYPYSYS